MSQLRQRDPEFREYEAEIVAISPDDQQATKELVERLELPFTVLSDPHLEAAGAYHVRHIDEPSGRRIPRPATFVIGPDGLVLYAYVGENARDRPGEDDLLAVVRGIAQAK
ncbi:MAG: redoxin domain-containing protein [Bacillota bacterium]|nr:redoxin domain-containing protein [Bacillota bacterium]